MLGLLSAGAAAAQSTPPRDLLKQVAANGSLFEQERDQYAYRQSFRFTELDKNGTPRGDYYEIREIIFSPEGERSEQFVKGPFDRLKYMRLTEEDFRDIRDMQPFVLTEDTLWLYQTRFQGEEILDGRNCWVYRIRPRQVLDGQRLLDGQVWIDQESLQVVQAGGLPLPQHFSTENSNLFPHFVTIYQPIDGKFWFPVKTVADDFLAFSSGVQHVRYEIEFAEYKRFSAESTIRFGEGEGTPEGPAPDKP